VTSNCHRELGALPSPLWGRDEQSSLLGLWRGVASSAVPRRHCERSEAIQEPRKDSACGPWIASSQALLAMTVIRTRALALAAQCARVDQAIHAPKTRGRREGPVPARTHGPRATKSTRQNHRYRRIIRPSLRSGFNGVLRALPGDRALLPPSPRGLVTCRTRSGQHAPRAT
jgi:hypothetical protein